MKINVVVALVVIVSAQSALLNAKANETNVSRETFVKNYLALTFDNAGAPPLAYWPTQGTIKEYSRKKYNHTEIEKIQQQRSGLESKLKQVKEETGRYQQASQVSFGIGLGAFTLLALGTHDVIPKIFPVLGGLYMTAIIGIGALLLLKASNLYGDTMPREKPLFRSLAGIAGLGFIGIGLALGLLGLGSLGSGITTILALGGFAFGVLNKIRESKAQEASIKIEKEVA